MRLTVLGSSASYAAAGQACAGHLVEEGFTRVLLDCGHGVLANLATVSDPLGLDAVFVTHAHPDHIVDLYALQALLRYAPGGPVAPLPLYAPPGLLERMGCLLSDRGRAELAEAFVSHDLADGVGVEIGEVFVTPVAVTHGAPAFAFVVESETGRLCYTGDCAPSEALLVAAASVDLLLAEATLPDRYAGAAPHLTAAQAAEVAWRAGAGALVLTHVWPSNDRAAALDEAVSVFDGWVRVAEEFDVYDVGAGFERGREGRFTRGRQG